MIPKTGLLLLTACLLGAAGTVALDHPMLGEPAPAFDLPTTDGSTLSLADLSGKIVVLHFGAGW